MSKVMSWVKANVPIVACCATILVVLPAAWFGSSMWNGKIRTSRELAAQKVDTDLKTVNVSYSISSAFQGGPVVTVPVKAPNPALTTLFKEARGKLDQQVTEVVKVAEQINQAEHKPLIDGLFPNPTDKLLTLTFIETLVGKGDKPSVYASLLKSINAGGPADPAALAEMLANERTQAIERNKAEHNTDKLSPDDEAALAKTLAQLRLSEYRRYGRSVSVYALPSFFPQAPRVIPAEQPTEAECFRWQFDYWVVQDLLRAVDAANQKGGKRTGIEDSVVKRIELVAVDAALPEQPTGQPSMAQAPSVSVTGRKPAAGLTAPFDLRNADMTIVVASARLPEFLNAISRTNFMTVTSMDFTDMNPWDDLEQGYYYGNDHVVRAHLKIETVWLRSWTMPLMPETIKNTLKAAEAPPPEPPPPTPPPRATRDEGEGAPKAKGKTLPPKKGRPRKNE